MYMIHGTQLVAVDVQCIVVVGTQLVAVDVVSVVDAWCMVAVDAVSVVDAWLVVSATIYTQHSHSYTAVSTLKNFLVVDHHPSSLD